MRAILLSILKNQPGSVSMDMQELMRKEHDSLIQAHHRRTIPLGLLTQIEMESFGGPCPKCRSPWVKRYVENIYVKFDYWQPSCTCYPVCFNCGNYLLYEIEEGKKHCMNCRHMPSCTQWIESSTTGKGAGRGSKKKYCEGRYLLGTNGYSCDTCGHEKSFVTREGLIVPEIYAGGIKKIKK